MVWAMEDAEMLGIVSPFGHWESRIEAHCHFNDWQCTHPYTRTPPPSLHARTLER